MFKATQNESRPGFSPDHSQCTVKEKFKVEVQDESEEHLPGGTVKGIPSPAEQGRGQLIKFCPCQLHPQGVP